MQICGEFVVNHRAGIGGGDGEILQEGGVLPSCADWFKRIADIRYVFDIILGRVSHCMTSVRGS